MKRKRVISLLAVLAMTISMLTGCGSSDQAQESAKPAQSKAEAQDSSADASAEAQGTGGEAVTIWYYRETEGHQVALDQVIQEYNASQDAYEVTAKYVPFADFSDRGI